MVENNRVKINHDEETGHVVSFLRSETDLTQIVFEFNTNKRASLIKAKVQSKETSEDTHWTVPVRIRLSPTATEEVISRQVDALSYESGLPKDQIRAHLGAILALPRSN